MPPDQKRSLERTLARDWSPERWRDVSVVVAVSGGPDSVAVLRALLALKQEAGGPGKVIVAHFNHRLRPEAAQDAQWVEALARSLHLNCVIDSASVQDAASEEGDGIEAAARSARYRFLQDIAEQVGARYVVTGHTADDQVETVLFNVLRGTGLSGLAGMQHARPLGPAVSVVRPFLRIHKPEILQYLEELGQSYLIDSSNASHDFTRNRIRQEILPFLRQGFAFNLDDSLTRLASIAASAQELIEGMADDLLDRCLAVADQESSMDAVMVDVAPLAGTNRHLVREVFVCLWRRKGWPMQKMGFAEWNALAGMAIDQPNSAPITLPGNLIARREQQFLRISRNKKPGDTPPRA